MKRRSSAELAAAAEHQLQGYAGDDDAAPWSPPKSGHGGAVTSPRDIDRSGLAIGEGRPGYAAMVRDLYADSRG